MRDQIENLKRLTINIRENVDLSMEGVARLEEQIQETGLSIEIWLRRNLVDGPLTADGDQFFQERTRLGWSKLCWNRWGFVVSREQHAGTMDETGNFVASHLTEPTGNVPISTASLADKIHVLEAFDEMMTDLIAASKKALACIPYIST